MIAIAKPFVGTEEKEAVCKVIDSGMIACGAVVEQFEKEFAAYAGTEYGIATTSGTTALEVAIRSLGIGPSDYAVFVYCLHQRYPLCGRYASVCGH